MLKKIQLSFNPALDAVANSHLSEANWSLRDLRLSHTPVDAAMAAQLAQLHLFNLTTISLENTGLTSEALSKLEFADWSTLRHLDLSHNDVDALAMQHLCMVHLPALRIIVLNNANIAREAAYWLAQGSWPLLTGLDTTSWMHRT